MEKKRFSLHFPLYKILLAITLLYFIIFGFFMAYTSGQPDQNVHNHYSLHFSKTWRIPEEVDDYSAYIFTGQPYLYYWINGFVIKIFQFLFLNNPPVRPVILLRLFSVFLSTFTVFFAYKLASKVTNNPYFGVLCAFFLSNTLMFVYVSGGINYDNLMNLAAMASLFHLVSLFKNEDFVKNTALIGTWVVIGSLSKEQFLLLALIIFLTWVYYVIKENKRIKLNFTKKNLVFVLLLFVFLILFFNLYGTNIILYSRITPMCTNIKPKEKCIGYESRWEHYEPYNWHAIWFFRDNLPNFIEYAFQFWLYKMVQSIWGILSHNSFIPQFSVALHSLLVLWGFICFIRYWHPTDKIPMLLIVILLSYGFYFLIMNYFNDINFQFQHFAVSGRYFSPLYGIILTLMIYYFTKIKAVFLKRLTFALSILLYFTGGLWMYISRYAEVFIHWRLYG